MRFPFRFTAPYRLPALALGITPATAYVDLGDRDLTVRFGLWRLRTPLDNLASWQQSGGFSFVKTAGPPRLSFTDRGVTFATNGDQALCLQFREPVRVLDPTGRVRHRGATVTVDDPAGLARALTEQRREDGETEKP